MNRKIDHGNKPRSDTPVGMSKLGVKIIFITIFPMFKKSGDLLKTLSTYMKDIKKTQI